VRNRGLRYADKGDFKRAIADYTTAIRINPVPRSDVSGGAARQHLPQSVHRLVQERRS
jgi:hypothetical protein